LIPPYAQTRWILLPSDSDLIPERVFGVRFRMQISGEGKRFNPTMVARIRSNYDLEARYSRLRARGMLTLAEIAKRLDISAATAKTWRRAGLLRSHRYNDKGETLFEQPGPNTPIKYQYQRKNRANSMASAVGRNSTNS
jgi:hypothetical protein